MTDDYVIPLYERAKNQIYDEYQRLKRQSSLFLTSHNSQKKYAKVHFRTKFFNFYMEIYIQDSYIKLPEEWRKILDYYFNDVSRIKKDYDVQTIMAICSEVMKTLNITNIGMQKNDRAF